MEEPKIGDHTAATIYQTERGDGLEPPKTFSWTITYDDLADYDDSGDTDWGGDLTEKWYSKTQTRTNPFDGEQYEFAEYMKQEYFGPYGRSGVTTRMPIASSDKSIVYAGIDANGFDTPAFKEYYFYQVVDKMTGHTLLEAQYSTKDNSLISYYTVTEDYYSWGFCQKYYEAKANGQVINSYEKHLNNFYEEQEVLPYNQ